MVGDPSSFSVTRSSRFVAASATNPSSVELLERDRERIGVEQPRAGRLEVDADVHVERLERFVSSSVSIVDRQLWTLTLNRNGPFGDEHVPGTYARSPLIVIDSRRFGNAPVTLSNTAGEWLARQACCRPRGTRTHIGDRFQDGPCRSRDCCAALMTVTRPSRPSSAPSLWVSGTRIVGGLQREELRDVTPSCHRR